MSHVPDRGCVLYTCADERDNPYDKHRKPKRHATWREAYWAVRLEYGEASADALKEDAGVPHEQCQFALIWRPFPRPFRLRVNDVVRIDGRLGRIIRVTDCAAVVLVNPPARAFTTRFDRKVRFQPSAVTVRISANSETQILNRRTRKPRKHRQTERRTA